MRRMKLLYVVLLFATGCSGFFHKPRPDIELPLSERPARVTCEWVLRPAGEEGAKPGPAGAGEAWAADVEGRRLILDGRLVDGMFEVTGVQAASDKDDRDVVPVGQTAAAVAAICESTISRLEETPGARLVRAPRATREGEGVSMPLVYVDDPQRSRPVSRLVVFGDSLSDDGNLKHRLKVFPNSPYWLGRFSDGPTWVEHLEVRTGTSVQNNAYGGAAATKHEDVPYEEVVAVISQSGQFFVSGSIDGQVSDYLDGEIGQGGFMQASDETAFVLWGGANDYMVKEPFSSDVRTMLDTPGGEAGYRRVAGEVVQSLGDQVRRLYAVGGRRFMLLNLPNLGFTPMVLHNTSYKKREEPEEPEEPEAPKVALESGLPEAPDEATGTEESARSEDARRIELGVKLAKLSLYHNKLLHKEVVRLRGELPEATILLLNAAEAMGFMLDGRSPVDPEEVFDYGFAMATNRVTLRDVDRQLTLQDRCYGGGYLGTGDASLLCENAGTSVFWDSVHPSSLTHCWVAYFVQEAAAEAGWTTAPDLAAHRAYCLEQVALSRALPVPESPDKPPDKSGADDPT